MLRISTTMIDQYLRYRDNEEAAEDDLIRSIKHETVASKAMTLGTAFHAVLADPHKYYDDKTISFIYEGIVFPWKVMGEALKYVDSRFPFECPSEKIYEVNGEKVTVTIRADQLAGLEGREFKSNWSYYQMEKYLNSYQWRFYIDIFKVERVQYTVFEMQDTAEGFKLNNVHGFYCDPYPGLESDCLSALSEFVEYIHYRNLEQYFQLRDSKPALDMSKKAFEGVNAEINKPELNGYAAMFGKPFNNGVLK